MYGCNILKTIFLWALLTTPPQIILRAFTGAGAIALVSWQALE
jgi:hypothetical protein